MNRKIDLGTTTVELRFDQFESPNMSAALAVWEDLRGDRAGPLWSDFDLTEFPAPLVRYASVVDVIDDGRDFRYRFWGSGLVETFKRENTGTAVSDLPTTYPGHVRGAQMRAVVEDREPKLFVTSLSKSASLMATKTNLRLPVMDDEGRVDKVLTFSEVAREPVGEDIDLGMFFALRN